MESKHVFAACYYYICNLGILADCPTTTVNSLYNNELSHNNNLSITIIFYVSYTGNLYGKFLHNDISPYPRYR